MQLGVVVEFKGLFRKFESTKAGDNVLHFGRRGWYEGYQRAFERPNQIYCASRTRLEAASVIHLERDIGATCIVLELH